MTMHEEGKPPVSGLTRFLGDSPARVIVKLIVLSLVVGLVMNAFHFSPMDVWYGIQDMAMHVYYMGFDALGRFFGYILLGACVVVPLFLVLRLVSYRK